MISVRPGPAGRADIGAIHLAAPTAVRAHFRHRTSAKAGSATKRRQRGRGQLSRFNCSRSLCVLGGYLISGDFNVDARTRSAVFPAQALVEDDVLGIEPIHLQDDAYLVRQECAVADRHDASLARVWGSTNIGDDDARHNRVRIIMERYGLVEMQRGLRTARPVVKASGFVIRAA